jgi:hypothetical protein
MPNWYKQLADGEHPGLESCIVREWLDKKTQRKRGSMRVSSKKTHIHDPVLNLKCRSPKQPNTNIGECPVCLEDKKLTLLGCRHALCRSCNDSITENSGCLDNCPLCRVPMYNAEPVDYMCEYGRRYQRQYILRKVDDQGLVSYLNSIDIMYR